jgi:hypothetical protein
VQIHTFQVFGKGFINVCRFRRGYPRMIEHERTAPGWNGWIWLGDYLRGVNWSVLKRRGIGEFRARSTLSWNRSARMKLGEQR